MAKFIKSLFSPPAPEKRKNIRDHGEPEGEGDNPIGERRKLSMSRSGRLKHSYKKRHSLSLELYGKDDEMRQLEKPKSMEYHVHSSTKEAKDITKDTSSSRKNIDASAKNGQKSPEEEIDSAFEILDKS